MYLFGQLILRKIIIKRGGVRNGKTTGKERQENKKWKKS